MDRPAPSAEPLFRIVNDRGEPVGMPASYDTIVVAGHAMLEEDPDMALTIEQLGADRRWRSSFVMRIAEPYRAQRMTDAGSVLAPQTTTTTRSSGSGS